MKQSKEKLLHLISNAKNENYSFFMIPRKVKDIIFNYVNMNNLSTTKGNTMVAIYEAIMVFCDKNGYTKRVRQRKIAEKANYSRVHVCNVMKDLYLCELVVRNKKYIEPYDMFAQIYEYYLPLQDELQKHYSAEKKMKALIEKVKNKQGNDNKGNSNDNDRYGNRYAKPIDHFNDYEQREYDYNDLERKLLGWQTDE